MSRDMSSFLPILTVSCHSQLAWTCKSRNICGQRQQWQQQQQMDRPITLPLVHAHGVVVVVVWAATLIRLCIVDKTRTE